MVIVGAIALAKGANLWPLTAMLGAVIGLGLGVILGLLFKRLHLAMRYAWVGLCSIIALSLVVSLSIMYYPTKSIGKLIQVTIEACKPSEHFFYTTSLNMKDKNKINGVDLEITVMKERKVEKLPDGKISLSPWQTVQYQSTYFMHQSNCENLAAGTTLILRSPNSEPGSSNDLVYDIQWDIDQLARDGAFALE